jgi:uncharacterized membrane protein
MHGFTRTVLSRVAFTLLLVGAGCGDSGGGNGDDPRPGPMVDCETAHVPGFSELTAFEEVCTNCHLSSLTGPDRSGAPPSINFDVYDTAVQYSRELLTQVSTGRMPPEGSGFSLTAAQKQELYAWGQCGTPE